MAWSEIFHLPFKTTPYQFNLHGLCDLQIGSSSTSINIIKQRIREIVADPNDCGVIIPGDIEDEDRPSTRAIRRAAFAGREEVITRDAQKHMKYIDDEIIPILLPLQKTKYGIMGVLAGHHFTQLSPVINSAQYICQELTRITKKKVCYLGQMSSFLDMRFNCNGQKSLRIVGHVQHGAGGGQTKASSLNKIEQAFQSFEADFYIRAHSCQRVGSMTDRLYPKENKLANGQPEMLHKTVAYLNLGSATRGYEMTVDAPSYIESQMMRPVTCGWGSISFIFRKALSCEDRHHNMKVDMRVTV